MFEIPKETPVSFRRPWQLLLSRLAGQAELQLHNGELVFRVINLNAGPHVRAG